MTNLLDDITKNYTVGDRFFSVSECDDYNYISRRDSKYDNMIFDIHERVGVNTWAYSGKLEVCVSARYCYGDNFDEDDIIEMLDEEFNDFVYRNEIE